MLNEHSHHDSGSDFASTSTYSRSNAINVALNTGFAAHAVVCVLTVFVTAALRQNDGVMSGIGMAILLFGNWPILVLPAMTVVEFGIRLAFSQSPLHMHMVRSLMILYEMMILGWVIVWATCTSSEW